jgi:type 1 glutamine amidotransferase
MSPTMRTKLVSISVVAALAATLWAGSGGSAAAPVGKQRNNFDALVFSRTAGFRHASIPAGIAAIRELGEDNAFGVKATEDPAQFTRRNLKRFDVVIFLNTTGTVLEEPQKRAFMRFVRRGGGYVGIHSAADTEYDWPFYGRLVGAYFANHPIQQSATFVNEGPRHPATEHLDERFEVFDEFYSFRTNPRPNVRVLLTIDESTYSPDPNTSNLPGGEPATGYMGDHPMSWCHDRFRGRAFYTALGHENYLYELGWFQEHLLGGILTAADAVRANCTPRPAP